ncbi:MAG: hypothetical protein ACKVJG_23075 [Candidatus Latescibacterota bacterium]
MLKALALTVAAHWVASEGMSEIQRTTLLVGPVYFALYLLSGAASRQAHRVVAKVGSEEAATRHPWSAIAAILALLTFSAYYQYSLWLIVAFVSLHVVQNIWRPILISRFDSHSSEAQGATVLSIESQGRRTATMLIAPLLGLAVDWVRAGQIGGPFWPIGLLGLVIAIAFRLTAQQK